MAITLTASRRPLNYRPNDRSVPYVYRGRIIGFDGDDDADGDADIIPQLHRCSIGSALLPGNLHNLPRDAHKEQREGQMSLRSKEGEGAIRKADCRKLSSQMQMQSNAEGGAHISG